MNREHGGAALHITLDMDAGRHYAGSDLPPGATLAGCVRQGSRLVGALLLMPLGLWVRYNAGETTPLSVDTGAIWLKAVCAGRQLTPEECAGLARVKPARMESWMKGEAVDPKAMRRLLTALHLLK